MTDPLTHKLQPLHHVDSALHYWEYNPNATVTIVAIHGYRGTHHGLERIIAYMPDVRFIVPDLPGFGESKPLKDTPHTVEQYAHSMANFITRHNLQGNTILGHSMGSIVAAELVQHHPELAKDLILINPIAADPRTDLNVIITKPAIFYQWLGGKVLPRKLGRALLDGKLFLLAGSILMAKTRDKTLRKIVHANHLTHMTEYDSPAMLYEAYLSSISNTVRERAAHITLPTLMIAGQRDELAPPASQQRLLDELADARLVMIDNVGHLIHYEKAAEAAAAITEFITPKPARK